MGKNDPVPDAWDDDWVAQADVQDAKNSTAEQPAKVSKAERLAKHAESNRKLWDSAESTNSFLFLAAKDDVPLKTEFKPAVKVLSRKPAPKTTSTNDPTSGLSQLTLGDEDDEDEDSAKKNAPSPEELRLKTQKEREEKQRRYEEARERLFGSSGPTSGTSSPGALTPPNAGESKTARGRGKGRGGRDSRSPAGAGSNLRRKNSPGDTTAERISEGRQLYDPTYSIKPDSVFIQKRTAQLSGTDGSISDEGQQPIRAPRGPDRSGRGGFGFSQRAQSGFPKHLKNVPYRNGPGSTSLNTLDVCFPRKLAENDLTRIWVIYIHGGAWRDPDTLKEAFEPALRLLLDGEGSNNIAGFASINYRLSPYPQHPTKADSADDPATNAKHPDHIHDVLAALQFLQNTYGFGDRYLLVGHSCGATLAFQVLMGRWCETQGKANFVMPLGVLGLAGIYDLVGIRDRHRGVQAYQDFLQDAFGVSEDDWVKASPINGEYAKSWPNGSFAMIVHSLEDGLVEEEQTTLMVQTLKRDESTGSERMNVLRYLRKEKHDEIWERGIPLATMVSQAVDLLVKARNRCHEADIKS